MSNNLHLPFALDCGGRLVSPVCEHAPVERWCCECKEPLRWTKAHVRSGVPVVAYFSHEPDSKCGATGESYAHLTAKIRIREQIAAAIGGDGAWPTIRSKCSCGLPRLFAFPFLVEATSVVSERNLSSGLRPDVTVLGSDGALFAVEVVHTNPMSAAKIAAIGLPWVEVSAQLFDHGSLEWPALRIGFDVERCAECVAREERARVARESAARFEAQRLERLRLDQERMALADAERRKRNAEWLAGSDQRQAEQRLIVAAADAERRKRNAEQAERIRVEDVQREQRIAYSAEEAKAEWRNRGAVLVTSGAIVTHLNQNTKDFRRRMYATLELGWTPVAKVSNA